jgi:opacity protein-like surface antigen
MRTAGLIVVTALMATPAFAQGEHGTAGSAPAERGYVLGTGAFDSSTASLAGSAASLKSGSGAAQAGVRVARHVLLFGEVGRFKDLEPAGVQASVNNVVTSLSTNQGLDVTGTSRMPATYGLGGVRIQGSMRHRVTPYALAGFGGARLKPSAQFTYTDGTLPNADPTLPGPAVGSNVTSQLIAAGSFVQPAPTSAFMVALGGGAQVNVARHLIADVGYRYSRIAADTPLHAQGVTFGFGVKF